MSNKGAEIHEFPSKSLDEQTQEAWGLSLNDVRVLREQAMANRMQHPAFRGLITGVESGSEEPATPETLAEASERVKIAQRQRYIRGGNASAATSLLETRPSSDEIADFKTRYAAAQQDMHKRAAEAAAAASDEMAG